MSDRSTEHATFVLERSYDAAAGRVFDAWASVDAKSAWFGPPGGGAGYELDFRVGGRERFMAEAPDGARYTYTAVYYDIVPEQRIVMAYEMYRGEERISVSVATVEFEAQGERTLLRFTEQGAFLDGHDTCAAREHGTRVLLERLAAALGPR